MPELYNAFSDRVLMPGDVVMCVRHMPDKRNPGKTWDWRFFMVVTEETRFAAATVEGIVLGATSEHLQKNAMKLFVSDPKNTVHFLEPEEWPDGVHQGRMALILKRKVDIL